MGFWVGGVRGVIRFAPDEVEATGFASAVDPRVLKGMGYDRGGDLVAVLVGERLCDFSLEDPEPGAGSATRGDARRPGPEVDPMSDRPAAVAAGGGGDDLATKEPPTSMVKPVDLRVGAPLRDPEVLSDIATFRGDASS
jgi:hypothetical protein